jgi:hypothetical protein
VTLALSLIVPFGLLWLLSLSLVVPFDIKMALSLMLIAIVFFSRRYWGHYVAIVLSADLATVATIFENGTNQP